MKVANIRVLIVDDEDGILSNTTFFLEEEGYEVSGAATGHKAVEIAAIEKHDIGIIDYRLPDTNGDELILELHKIDSEMKFIIFTGSNEYKMSTKLEELGMSKNEIFRKPIADMNDLAKAIKRLTNR